MNISKILVIVAISLQSLVGLASEEKPVFTREDLSQAYIRCKIGGSRIEDMVYDEESTNPISKAYMKVRLEVISALATKDTEKIQSAREKMHMIRDLVNQVRDLCFVTFETMDFDRIK